MKHKIQDRLMIISTTQKERKIDIILARGNKRSQNFQAKKPHSHESTDMIK